MKEFPFLSCKLFSIYYHFGVGKTAQIFKIYYLEKVFSLGLMDKAKFTDKVKERLLIVQGIHIMKKILPISNEVLPYQNKYLV